MTTTARWWNTSGPTSSVAEVPVDQGPLVARLVELAVRGLTAMHEGGAFPQTVRGVPGPDGPRIVAEGRSLRYAAIAALGIGRLEHSVQQEVLGGRTARTLARQVAREAARSVDPGLVALAAWASAEVADEVDHSLLEDLAGRLARRVTIPVVDLAWTLTAAVAAGERGYSFDLARAAAARLLAAQGPTGAFGHVDPLDGLPAYRRHVGCFADQVYPIQALARWSRHEEGHAALAAAIGCAEVIVQRQGECGQWWWHYDRRDGAVVEGYPVYSVHQHGMAPMVLTDLRRAGGPDHRAAVLRGLGWTVSHPEIVPDLVDDRLGVVWRKVGRRERAKVARGLAAATTALRPGLKPPWLERLAPPVVVDYECRPYELGWLLYSWADAQSHGDGR